MKKLILAFTITLSSFAFANDEGGVDFFGTSETTNAGGPGIVDDPDPDPNAAPISDYVLPLIVSAACLGFYYTRKKVLQGN